MKQWLMSSHFSSQNVTLTWKHSVKSKNWHSYGQRPSSIMGSIMGKTLLESKHAQHLIFKGSPHAYKFDGTSRFTRQPLHNKWWWVFLFLQIYLSQTKIPATTWKIDLSPPMSPPHPTPLQFVNILTKLFLPSANYI